MKGRIILKGKDLAVITNCASFLDVKGWNKNLGVCACEDQVVYIRNIISRVDMGRMTMACGPEGSVFIPNLLSEEGSLSLLDQAISIALRKLQNIRDEIQTVLLKNEGDNICINLGEKGFSCSMIEKDKNRSGVRLNQSDSELISGRLIEQYSKDEASELEWVEMLKALRSEVENRIKASEDLVLVDQ